MGAVVAHSFMHTRRTRTPGSRRARSPMALSCMVVDEDHALLQSLRAGEEVAFEAFVSRHDATLRGVARSFVRTSAAADDVVQETWLAMLRGLNEFEGRSSLRTWLFQILVNRARTRAKREACRSQLSKPRTGRPFSQGLGRTGAG